MRARDASTGDAGGPRETAPYFDGGAARAVALGNRGPLRFDVGGGLAPEIAEAYETHGFYVFEGLIGDAELEELEADLAQLVERLPANEGAACDRAGRPAIGADGQPRLVWARPLSDPFGGTDAGNGRFAERMGELEPAADAPEKVPFLILGVYAAMPAALRLAGHADLLRAAEAVNGPGFVPYNDALFLKEPGLGAAVAWHQDGTTHWESPSWHPGIHGFNFMAQLRRTTPANALWVVPGSHRRGRVDISERVRGNSGSVRFPDAVPMLADRGDVAICNRQCLHGSFANASPDARISLVWGYFPSSAVIDVTTDNPLVPSSGQEGRKMRYTAEHVESRRELIDIATAARREHHPGEAGPSDTARTAEVWTPEARSRRLGDYTSGTIFI